MTDVSWFKQRLGDLLQPVVVQGDRPLLLDDPSCAYVTLSEHHQLFCVGYRDGQPFGRREHMAVCEPGQLLFGVLPPVGQASTALLLSGVSGSVVWQVPMAALFSLERDGRLAALIDRWVALLISTLPHAQVPSGSRSLGANETCTDVADRVVYAQTGLLWVTPPRAPQLYRGVEVAELSRVAMAWPLASDAWLLGDSNELRGQSTEALLEAGVCAAYVSSFSAFANAVAAKRRAGLAAERLDRDEHSLHAEVDKTQSALMRLAQVAAQPSPNTDEALERACDSVFRTLGLADLPVVSPPRSYTLSDIQIALSNVSGVRTRTVKLDETLHTADAGPLLAFVPGEDGLIHPVALLPRSSGGYLVEDPHTQRQMPLGQQELESLHPEAQQFYRPFPARAMSAWSLLRFAASGLRVDVLRILLAGMAVGLISTLLPLLTGRVYDEIIPAAERRYLWEILAVLLAVFTGSALFELSRSLLLLRMQTRMDISVEAGTWDRVLSLPLPFFRDYAAGDLADRAEGIGTLRELLAQAGLSALLACIFSAWNFALLFVYDVSLALAATGLVAIAALVAVVSTYRELGYQRALSEIDGRLSGLLLQVIGGIAKLRSSGAENRAFAVWAGLFTRRRDIAVAAAGVDVRVSVFEAMYPLLCSMCLFWLMARSALTTGQFLAFSAAFALFMRAVLALCQRSWKLSERCHCSSVRARS